MIALKRIRIELVRWTSTGQDDWALEDPVGSSCDFQLHPGPGEHEQLHESVQRSPLAAWQTAGGDPDH